MAFTDTYELQYSMFACSRPCTMTDGNCRMIGGVALRFIAVRNESCSSTSGLSNSAGCFPKYSQSAQFTGVRRGASGTLYNYGSKSSSELLGLYGGPQNAHAVNYGLFGLVVVLPAGDFNTSQVKRVDRSWDTYCTFVICVYSRYSACLVNARAVYAPDPYRRWNHQ
jgi:hypothetical protein